MHPKNIAIADFTYHLPTDKIALHPCEPRDMSKLLVYEHGSIQESTYQHLPQFLPHNSTLVFNNTKVVEARIIFEKNTGSKIEIFCLEPADIYADITQAMMQYQKVVWKCLVGGAKKWKEGLLTKTIEEEGKKISLTANLQEKKNDYFLIEFTWNNHQLTFAEVLHLAGIIPLPPYINREAEEKDATTYQTVYAKENGSVAAPTAGLHFTTTLLENLANNHVNFNFITLHVGAGTFKPVKAAKIAEHEMHAEFIEVSKASITQLQQAVPPIVAVGTTSLRTIETLYWMGVKINLLHQQHSKPIHKINIEEIVIKQWDAYEIPATLTLQESLTMLLNWMDVVAIEKVICKTQILIAPGYNLKVADGLITNFHQPQSTLLLLIASIVGDDWKKVYDYALHNNFRFLSYGDGSLLWKKTINS